MVYVKNTQYLEFWGNIFLTLSLSQLINVLQIPFKPPYIALQSFYFPLPL